jgi:hypothetical protein
MQLITTLWRRHRAAFLASVLVATGCGGSPEAPRALARLSISPAKPSIEIGQTKQLGVQVRDADGLPMYGVDVSWQSSNAAVASVDSHGLVRGLGKGVSTIRATAQGLWDSTVLSVGLTPVADVMISDGSLVMQPSGSHRLGVTAYDDQRQPLGPRATTWRSTDPAIATVSDSGLVTARALGTTRIVATIDGVSDTANVRVGTAHTGQVRLVIHRLWLFDIAYCQTGDTTSLNVHWAQGVLRATTSGIVLHCESLFGSGGYYGFPAQDATVGLDDADTIALQLKESGNRPAILILRGDLSSEGTAVLQLGAASPEQYAGRWSVVP